MHRYLRAIGYSEVKSRADAVHMLNDLTRNTGGDDLFHPCGKMMGVRVIRNRSYDDFSIEALIPEAFGNLRLYADEVSFQTRGEGHGLSGILEDPEHLLLVAFFCQNHDFVENHQLNNCEVRLSGLALSGKIYLPAREKEREPISELKPKRFGGEKLSSPSSVMDIIRDEERNFEQVTERLENESIYEVIDTLFMPYGIECDKFEVMGNILEMEYLANQDTGEKVYRLDLDANGVLLSVFINEKDLFGEPKVGRRFKGNVWLQGIVNSLP